MTIAETPIARDVRERAQGPHTLSSVADGGYFLSLSDLPKTIRLDHDEAARRLTIHFGYEVATSGESFGGDLWWSTQVDSLRMHVLFSKTKRRLITVQFRDYDAKKVDARHLADGVVTAVKALGETASIEDLSPTQVLALKAVAIVFSNELPRIIEVSSKKK